MNLDTICQQILQFKAEATTEDFEIDIFFDKVGEEIHELGTLNNTQKEQLIKTLFQCIANQHPEMEANFSFIHLIENIDAPDFKMYDVELLKFTKALGTITSVLLLNRHLNSLKKTKQTESLDILKAIAENKNYSEHIRQEALNYYNYQKTND